MMRGIIIFFLINFKVYSDDLPSDGLTIFTSFSFQNKTTYLIDNNQNVIKTWLHSNSPASHPYLLPDTSIIYPYKVQEPSFGNNVGGVGGGIQHIDNDGRVLWNYTISDSLYQQHHDIEILANNNILILVWERKSSTQAEDAGRQIIESELNEIWSPAILEFNPTSQSIVWEWHIWDHLIQDIDSSLNNYGNISQNPQLININYGEIGSLNAISGDWMHVNSIDYNNLLDQIVISSRNMNEFYVIDHSTTIEESASHSGGNYGKGGDILYRWGNPEAYNMGLNEDKKLFGQHDVSWVEYGVYQNRAFLLFNNGIGRRDINYSTIDMIIFSIDSNGNYLMNNDSTFLPDLPLYVSCNIDFFSGKQSSAQLLPNGNILITSSAEKKIFEINENGNIIWDVDLSGMNFVNKSSKYSLSYFTNLTTYKYHNISPIQLKVAQNFPNPFNPLTAIKYDLPQATDVNISIYDMMGRQVRNLVNTNQNSGYKSVVWNGTNDNGEMVSGGMYFYSIKTNTFSQTRKMILLK